MSDLADGESIEIQGSARKPYIVKNTGGVYSCTCPAWRNQSLAIEQRTCKHIRKLRGDEAETKRVGNAVPLQKVSAAPTEGPPLLLAHRWENDLDLTDWWMSEKLDGVRAYWDGRRFRSRLGNELHAPDWFVQGLPESPLDGELWLDRKAFQRTVSIVRRQDKGPEWQQVRYVVFDAPALEAPFETRLEFLEDSLRKLASQFILPLEHQRCRSLDHLREELARVESLGGEGLMLRQPASRYEAGRSNTLLKVKTFHDEDAVVVEHAGGKGRHKGRLGALVVRLKDGTEFSVGTGFTDRQRDNPPAIGSTITFRYQELSDAGVPRFPSFVRVRTDAGAVGTPAATGKRKGSRSTAAHRTPTAAAAIPDADAGGRYFEFSDGKSSKFWEVAVAGTTVTVRFGRIGTAGQTKPKTFDDESSAHRHASKLIDEKTGKGYRETERPE
ncbi:MAG: DNA ligase [Planctomycetes bacterium]|nr:DNA ligase [Planctomycetota bacterium]